MYISQSVFLAQVALLVAFHVNKYTLIHQWLKQFVFRKFYKSFKEIILQVTVGNISTFLVNQEMTHRERDLKSL